MRIVKRQHLGWLLIFMACWAWLSVPTMAHAQAATNPDAPPGDALTWKPIFQDEFTGTALDTKKWHYCYWDANSNGCTGGNGEQEWYVPSATTVADGMLHIRADNTPVTTPGGQTYQYTSGLITTTGTFAFHYGYMEARFRTPKGVALWPSFWAVPTDHSWPTELDAMEILGQTPKTIYFTIHYKNAIGYHASDGSQWDGPDFSTGFHTIGVDWEPTQLTWYVDGVARKTVTDPVKIPTKPMEIILNLAVGGDWPGSPTSASEFPGMFDVDFVRVWQHTTVSATTTPAPIANVGGGTTTPGTTHVSGIVNSDLFLWMIGAVLFGTTMMVVLIVLLSNRKRAKA